jgi:hypothetical protein
MSVSSRCDRKIGALPGKEHLLSAGLILLDQFHQAVAEVGSRQKIVPNGVAQYGVLDRRLGIERVRRGARSGAAKVTRCTTQGDHFIGVGRNDGERAVGS